MTTRREPGALGAADEMHDRVIGELFDDLCRPEVAGTGGLHDDGPSKAARREYAEILGLLPHALELLEPRRGARAELLAAVRGGSGSAGGERRARAPRPAAPSRRGWLLPLAAGLILALGGLAAWQVQRLEGQRRQIAELASRLGAAEREAQELTEQRRRLAELDDRLAMVTSPGVEFCSLRPVGREPAQPASRGALFVAADHQHWFLHIDGLAPSPQGRAYQLWFIVGDGSAVSAGTFDAAPGGRVELGAETMPSGTRAVSVTLEPAGGSPLPSGPPILYGDQVMRLL